VFLADGVVVRDLGKSTPEEISGLMLSMERAA
jgi:hypothetical protein